MRNNTLCVLVVSLIVASGCVTSDGGQGRVGIVDSSSRVHLQTRLTMTDFVQFAEKVTNKLLTSRQVQGWDQKPPRLVVGKLVNNTHDENIRVSDIQDKINDMLLQSGLVRIMDSSNTSFDYIIRTEITSTRQRGDSGEDYVNYTMQMKMFKMDAKLNSELVGQWSDDLALGKAERPLF